MFNVESYKFKENI